MPGHYYLKVEMLHAYKENLKTLLNIWGKWGGYVACPASHSQLNQGQKSEIPVLYPWELCANLKISTPFLCP